MQYYQVKPTSDQVKASIRFKNDFLIANELYTRTEVNKALKAGKITKAFIETNLRTVELKPTNTFWFFGSRRQRPTA